MVNLRLKHTLSYSFFVIAFIYIVLNAFHGQQGVYALLKENYRLEVLAKEHASLQVQRERLQGKVDMMKDSSINADMLEEQTRKTLGVVGDNEIMIIVK